MWGTFSNKNCHCRRNGSRAACCPRITLIEMSLIIFCRWQMYLLLWINVFRSFGHLRLKGLENGRRVRRNPQATTASTETCQENIRRGKIIHHQSIVKTMTRQMRSRFIAHCIRTRHCQQPIKSWTGVARAPWSNWVWRSLRGVQIFDAEHERLIRS